MSMRFDAFFPLNQCDFDFSPFSKCLLVLKMVIREKWNNIS